MTKAYDGYTLLSVLAHPDDESFGMGGTLAYYAERGAEVHLVCATRGEVGEVEPEYLEGYESIADLREAELRCAASHLGIKKIHLLDYRDSGMPGTEHNNHPRALIAQPQDKVAQEVVDIIRTVKPDVVLTFDPIGGYRHPDHIYMHEITKAAFHAAGSDEFSSEFPAFQPQKLYYHTISKRYIKFMVRMMRLLGKDPSRYGKNNDIDLADLASVEFPTHAQIDYGPVADRKKAASACHASQGSSGLMGKMFDWIFRILGFRDKDQFMRAYPEPQQENLEQDLFAGL